MEDRDELIQKLIMKICCSAVQDLWYLMTVDGSVPEFAMRSYLEHNDNYQNLCEILNV